MLVVCDTTPINYLLQIGLVDLLPRLLTRACISSSVLEELMRPAAPFVVRAWANNLPEWMDVVVAVPVSDPQLLALHRGKRDAIVIAELLGAGFLLTGDFKVRTTAHRRGLSTLTTLLILDAAAARKWISFPKSIEELLRTNFRVDRLTIEQLTQKHSIDIEITESNSR